MQNRVYVICTYICIYVCMYVWIVRMPFKRARGELFLKKKHGFLGLTPVYSETTAYLSSKVRENSCEMLDFQETKS